MTDVGCVYRGFSLMSACQGGAHSMFIDPLPPGLRSGPTFQSLCLTYKRNVLSEDHDVMLLTWCVMHTYMSEDVNWRSSYDAFPFLVLSSTVNVCVREIPANRVWLQLRISHSSHCFRRYSRPQSCHAVIPAHPTLSTAFPPPTTLRACSAEELHGTCTSTNMLCPCFQVLGRPSHCKGPAFECCILGSVVHSFRHAGQLSLVQRVHV